MSSLVYGISTIVVKGWVIIPQANVKMANTGKCFDNMIIAERYGYPGVDVACYAKFRQ
jgi:hypothetical protein